VDLDRTKEGTLIVRRLSYRYQRTLARPTEVCGIGFLAGAAVRLRFQPAPPSTGIQFLRCDLHPTLTVPARIDHVTGTQRRTTLGHLPGQVSLVEHVLAALAGLRIDNCIIEVDSGEPPGVDGSAQAFVDALVEAGAVLQYARRAEWTVTEPVVLSSGGATLALHSTSEPGLKISYLLDYGLDSPIARQSHTETITPASFINELASARTFLLESEALELRRQGIGLRTTTADLLVIGPHGPIDNRLRWANELARHKILDIVGDLSLLGHDLSGHLVAYRSGHPLNIELVRELSRRLATYGEKREAA
jgi:UDP-3-O-acyl N-acetylglucosamine deacetylase